MTAPYNRTLTAGNLYLARCPHGCPIGLLAVEAVPNRAAAATALSEATGWPADVISIACLSRDTARESYPALADNRNGCRHTPPTGPG